MDSNESTLSKKITLSLSKFLDLILSHRDWTLFPDEELAHLIALLDKEESLCHIEFSQELNLMTITSVGSRPEDNFDGASKLPILWRKFAWENSQPKFILRKQQSNDRVAAQNLKTERINKLIRTMIENTGVDDRDIWESKAVMLVERKEWNKIEMIWGIKLN